jgi:Protein of unknown function (DUF2752)
MIELASDNAASLAHARADGFTRNDTFGYLGIATLATVTLGIARALTPAPAGFGTHQQLGLPACTFLHWTGYPCPSCGLTTCFAHAAHGDLLAAFIAQPFGVLLFLMTALAVPAALYCIRQRIAWSTVIYARKTNLVMRVMLVLYVLSWGYKIYAMKDWQ